MPSAAGAASARLRKRPDRRSPCLPCRYIPFRNVPMLEALMLLFLCQLAGEALVRLSGLTFPGPVLGMAIMLGAVAVAGRTGAALDRVSDTILKNLSLLFVPAAVGVVQQIDLIAANWLAVVSAVAVSTALTLIVTVVVFRVVARAIARP